ncbi:TetR/AcrR family transcriptional regulator [Actinomadura scrupuli]|uniref:TetR/AcrR family transcriptional regulator n=1 Tax=Actinomadura scrupuli TaxID=559629 RepID=UPI003D955AC9
MIGSRLVTPCPSGERSKFFQEGKLAKLEVFSEHGDMTQQPQLGLRERKKQATRTALSNAAWTLMLEKGLDAVTPESVAESVGVSGRTFRNYFFSREEAITEATVRRAESIADALRIRPASEPVWDSLTHVLPDAVSAMVSSREDVVVLLRVARENPTMLAAHLASFERVRRLLAQAIIERTGTDDLASHLLAAAAGTAVRISIEAWGAGDGSTSLPDIVRETITQLRAGIPSGDAQK